jgi:hypothetical protein
MNFWLSDTYKNRCILLRNAGWSIEQYTNENTGNPAIAVISKDGHVDLPVIYWNVYDRNKRVGFDHPERLPEYILNAVKTFVYHMDPAIIPA